MILQPVHRVPHIPLSGGSQLRAVNRGPVFPADGPYIYRPIVSLCPLCISFHTATYYYECCTEWSVYLPWLTCMKGAGMEVNKSKAACNQRFTTRIDDTCERLTVIWLIRPQYTDHRLRWGNRSRVAQSQAHLKCNGRNKPIYKLWDYDKVDKSYHSDRVHFVYCQ